MATPAHPHIHAGAAELNGFPQRKEGLRASNRVGKGGRAGSFRERGCWVKGDLAVGKDWVKSRLRLGFMSMYSPSLLLTPPWPRSFSSWLFNERIFFLSREGKLRGAVTYLCETERTRKLVAAIRHLNQCPPPCITSHCVTVHSTVSLCFTFSKDMVLLFWKTYGMCQILLESDNFVEKILDISCFLRSKALFQHSG